MKHDRSYRSFPKDQVSLHDCRITGIVTEPDAVVFEFRDGFSLVDVQSTGSVFDGKIKLLHCTIKDVNCKLIKRRATKKGVKFSGRTISIDALNRLLVKNHAIEIFVELYDDSFIHWLCTLYPPKRSSRRLLPHILIEANDFSSIAVEWNE